MAQSHDCDDDADDADDSGVAGAADAGDGDGDDDEDGVIRRLAGGADDACHPCVLRG